MGGGGGMHVSKASISFPRAPWAGDEKNDKTRRHSEYLIIPNICENFYIKQLDCCCRCCYCCWILVTHASHSPAPQQNPAHCALYLHFSNLRNTKNYFFLPPPLPYCGPLPRISYNLYSSLMYIGQKTKGRFKGWDRQREKESQSRMDGFFMYFFGEGF